VARGSSGRRHADAGRLHRSCCRPGDTRGPVNRSRSTICSICSTAERRQRREGEPLPCSATHRPPRNPARPCSTRSPLSAAMPRCVPRCPRPRVQDFPGNRPRPGLRTLRATEGYPGLTLRAASLGPVQLRHGSDRYGPHPSHGGHFPFSDYSWKVPVNVSVNPPPDGKTQKSPWPLSVA
jgi:hypothetical protein